MAVRPVPLAARSGTARHREQHPVLGDARRQSDSRRDEPDAGDRAVTGIDYRRLYDYRLSGTGQHIRQAVWTEIAAYLHHPVLWRLLGKQFLVTGTRPGYVPSRCSRARRPM